MPHLLSGLRVIDCGTYIAGPAAAVILSDFGAEVIKVERPPAGDPYRLLSGLPGMPVSPIDYCWVLDSRNKKSIALDLSDAAGREALLKLVASADVFITNYQPQLVRKFGLRFEELSALNPKLIYAQVTGYGENGPEAEKPGYDTTAYWARSGLMGSLHNADAEPARSPAGFGDHPTSVALFGAIMLGLYQRDRTGAGCKVSTSLMANGAWSNSCQIQAALCNATIPARITRKTTNNPLVNHYLSRDGERFVLCCLDPAKDWARLCAAIGRAELTGDPRFDTPGNRSANGIELVELLDREFGGEEMAEWKRRFAEQDVIWGPVPSFLQVAKDEQMQLNGVFSEVRDAPGGPLRTVSNPITVEGAPKVAPRMAPEVGEHSVEILRGLGYSEDAIDAMVKRGVTMARTADTVGGERSCPV
jgi:crotonobetainyl-CoA:carnitine CoA-transferase CaiB-like acyl-CoA transferase